MRHITFADTRGNAAASMATPGWWRWQYKGMLVDFKDLNRLLQETLEPLDHRNLNDLPPFTSVNPTAENIAKYLYETLAPRPFFQRNGVRLSSVRVWESPHSSVRYSGENS